MAGQDGLEDLARKGRDELAKRDAREVRRMQRRDRLRRAKNQLVAECSTTPMGWIGTGEVAALAPLLIIGVASLLVGRDHPLVLKAAVAFHVLLLLLLVGVRLQGKAGWIRETKWVAALPFPLESYLPGLGDLGQRTFAPHTSGKALKFNMVLEFQQEPPKDLEAIIAGFDAKLSVSRKDGRSLQVSHGNFPGGDTNYPLLRFIHRFVERVALPLHAQAPLSRMDVVLKC